MTDEQVATIKQGLERVAAMAGVAFIIADLEGNIYGVVPEK